MVCNGETAKKLDVVLKFFTHYSVSIIHLIVKFCVNAKDLGLLSCVTGVAIPRAGSTTFFL